MSGRGCLFALLVAVVLSPMERLAAAAPTNSVPEQSICMPVNSRVWKLLLPDGTKHVFLRDADDPAILQGTGGTPWAGVIRPERNMVNFVSRKERGGDGAELCFVGGRLRFGESGGVQQEFTPKPSEKAPEELWPQEPNEASRDAADIWRADRRLRFLSRNPNRSALLLVQLALVALGLVLGTRGKWFRLMGGMGMVLLLAMLAMTGSRGGMVAFAVAGGLEVGWYCRRWLKSKWVWTSLLVLAMLAGGGLWFGGGASRLAELRNRDASVGNRLCIWKEFPRMFATAPLGWGWGRSGYAYNDWFEAMDRHHATGDLFNDHFSRLAEFGMAGGTLYLFLFAAILLLSSLSATQGRSPVPAAVWTSLAVAGCFNPVQVWGWSWIVPVLTLADVRVRDAKWLWALVLAAGMSLVAVGGVWGAGKLMGAVEPPMEVAAGGSRICVKAPDPRLWVVDDGTVLDGEYPGFLGKELRARYLLSPDTPAMGLVRDLDALPAKMKILVVTGKRALEFIAMPKWPEVERVVLLSPPLGPQQVPAKLLRHCEVRLIVGEFLAERLDLPEKLPEWMTIVPGAALYIPGWLQGCLDD